MNTGLVIIGRSLLSLMTPRTEKPMTVRLWRPREFANFSAARSEPRPESASVDTRTVRTDTVILASSAGARRATVTPAGGREGVWGPAAGGAGGIIAAPARARTAATPPPMAAPGRYRVTVRGLSITLRS